MTRHAGIAKHVSPHTLRHAFITAALVSDPRTTMRYDRARTSLDRHATYIVAAFIAGADRPPSICPAALTGRAVLNLGT